MNAPRRPSRSVVRKQQARERAERSILLLAASPVVDSVTERAEADSAIADARTAGWKGGEARALEQRARREQGMEAVASLSTALTLVRRLGDVRSEQSLLQQLAQAFDSCGHHALAVNVVGCACRLAIDFSDDDNVRPIAFLHLAELLFESGRTSDALEAIGDTIAIGSGNPAFVDALRAAASTRCRLAGLDALAESLR
jgi:hypothetical protein